MEEKMIGKRRIKLSFAWLPCKVETGWAWLVPIMLIQQYDLWWVLMPEMGSYQSYYWKTIKKTVIYGDNRVH